MEATKKLPMRFLASDYTKLDPREWWCLCAALQAPSLWAFQLLMSQYGFVRAVERCKTGDVGVLKNLFKELGYDRHNLPPHDVVRYLVIGARLVANKYKNETWNQTAKRLKINESIAASSKSSLKYFGCKIKHILSLMGIRREYRKRARKPKIQGCESGVHHCGDADSVSES